MYKRLKKEHVDVDEGARKILTGGRINSLKLDKETRKLDLKSLSRLDRTRTVKNNAYTSMEWSSNILSGSLKPAMANLKAMTTNNETDREGSSKAVEPPNSVWSKGIITTGRNRGEQKTFDMQALHKLEADLIKKAKKKGQLTGTTTTPDLTQ